MQNAEIKQLDQNGLKNGYNLLVHNIASAEIYKECEKNFDYITYILIKTHGLIGQHIKGEVNLYKNHLITELITSKKISPEKLKRILLLLNQCIVEGVSYELYEKIKEKVDEVITKIINNDYPKETFSDKNYILKRMQTIFQDKSVEEFKNLDSILNNKKIQDCFAYIFKNFELWYIDSALEHFSMEQIVKILIIIFNNADTTKHKHINFESIMNDMYYMYNGVKVKNIYKLRIIESFLETLSFEEILENIVNKNEHFEIGFTNKFDTLKIHFNFSIQAQKLIAFCEVAYGYNELYNQAVFMLYDLFNFRRDTYDRFYNEINYLNTMNSTINHKAIILNYISGKTVLDVGPGGRCFTRFNRRIEKSRKSYWYRYFRKCNRRIKKEKICRK